MFQTKETMHDETLATLSKGLAGTVVPFLAVLTSFQQELDYWLRIASLCIGIAVGLASFISIVTKRPK